MKTYTVIYRTGGTHNFQWKKALPLASMQEAIVQKNDLMRQGYPALIHRTDLLDSIGLPDTYDLSIKI